jgi:hypothetical protein
MVTSKKCHPRNPKEEQFGIVVWGVVSQRLHNGIAQTWRTSIHRIEGSCNTSFGGEGTFQK